MDPHPAILQPRGGGEWSLAGTVTLAGVQGLLGRTEELLRGGGARRLDCSGVTRIDSTAVALLLEWRRSARRAQVQLTYLGLPRQLLAVAEVGGVAALLAG